MHNRFVSSISGRFVLELRTFRFGDYTKSQKFCVFLRSRMPKRSRMPGTLRGNRQEGFFVDFGSFGFARLEGKENDKLK